MDHRIFMSYCLTVLRSLPSWQCLLHALQLPSAWLSRLPTSPFPTHPACPTPFSQVYCLPDNYEVADRSLDDVRHVLNPTFAPGEISRLDKDVRWARTLDGEYTHANSMHARGWRMLQLLGCRIGACTCTCTGWP